MSKADKLRELIRQTIRETLEEMTVTGDVAGYNTPYAFTGGSSAGEAKRKKSATNSTGFMVVDGFEDGEDKADTLNIDDASKPKKDSIENRKKKVKPGQRPSLDEAANATSSWSNQEMIKNVNAIIVGTARGIISADKAKASIQKLLAQSTKTRGIDHVPGLDLDPVPVNEGKYHNWRNDATLKPKQKIGRAIREANNMLSQIDEMITMSSRLKTEAGVQTSDYWKNTNKALLKIETKLVKIINNIKNVR